MDQFEQGLLRYLSKEQLNIIQTIKVGIGGAGGLGSNVAMILIRSGFQNIEILDCDIINPSNLNRQQYFINEIGQSKVDTLKKRLLQINPEANIKTHNVLWAPRNNNQFFSNCDIIVEAFDQAQCKRQFVEFYQNKAKFIVSGNGMAGFLIKKNMGIKKIGNIYLVGDGTTDTTQGHPPMAPRVTACAAMMAGVILDFCLKQ